ncbi:cytochrome C oxidase subunit IV family protein [Aestuariirhabdus sp. Z084]|uniref:cytochrome C oxidase subunit IV family protein n=1 Tax=Aestuariirhabdus haliotis TaxID=2918751 RepID=UPI00201B4177|nr:cytochrome C oxidase subunit IV family protein [Aestuariirhabdus haliotis]MCL6416592.1 cytochrome C oxidase subunit IV family protein [Aestuariirhabdus haliotis]MCL6420541.1 cytochrome C oxidase subunit IV family protein [Aestuariirhabdus haliotis]
MVNNSKLKKIWLVLITLTLATSIAMETVDPNVWIVIGVSIIIGVKGTLVVDYLMGLKTANPKIRISMLCYFYFLPPLIALAMIYSEQLRDFTTL